MAARHDPDRPGPRCRIVGSCSCDWREAHGVLVGQCIHCRRLIGIVTPAVPPAGLSQSALAAMQSTDGRDTLDGWKGCID